MSGLSRRVLLLAVLVILAAGAGGWVGAHYGHPSHGSATSLNQLLHEQLHLSRAQRARLAAMESAYTARRRQLEGRAQAANRELAAALLSEHQYGPMAAQAIDHFYAAMKTLQQATVVHVLAMRAILTPAQQKRFDQTVTNALNSGHP